MTYQIIMAAFGSMYTVRQDHFSVNNLMRKNPQVNSLSVSSTKQLAFNQSFGFFDTISNEDWIKYYQSHVKEQLARSPPKNHSNNDDDDDDSLQNVSQWLYDNIDPMFVCPHPKKVGNPAGKWMCDPERWARYFSRTPKQPGVLPCLVYSIGSKGNFRWEVEFVEILGSDDLCEFHIFDPSPAYESSEILQKHSHWHYHPWGLRGIQSMKNYTRRRDHFFDFPTIRRQLGHENRPINVFKIDCEGCEWESMPDWLFTDKYPATMDFPDLHHVLLETHSLPFPDRVRWAGNFGRFLPLPEIAYLEKALAERGFVLYAKEVNTHQGLGRSVEWGFVRMSTDFFV